MGFVMTTYAQIRMHILFCEHLREIEVTNFGIDSRHGRLIVDKSIVSHWTNIVKKNLE